MVASKRVLSMLALTMTAVFVLLVVPAARADNFTFSVSGSTLVYLDSPNDNYWGTYESPYYGSVTTEVRDWAPYVYGQLNFTNVSFVLPAGSTITSGSIELILPTTILQGTSVATNVTTEHLPPPDLDSPVGTLPTFDPGTAYLYPFDRVNGIGSNNGTFDLTMGFGLTVYSPLINGNQISTGDLALTLSDAQTDEMEAMVATQGSNYNGYVDVNGEVNVPYTLEVVGTYTPAATPEPSAVVLLGTGMLALMAGAWWRRNAIG
jgi:hypothetical protein